VVDVGSAGVGGQSTRRDERGDSDRRGTDHRIADGGAVWGTCCGGGDARKLDGGGQCGGDDDLPDGAGRIVVRRAVQLGQDELQFPCCESPEMSWPISSWSDVLGPASPGEFPFEVDLAFGGSSTVVDFR
jgi:hypothetical protein